MVLSDIYLTKIFNFVLGDMEPQANSFETNAPLDNNHGVNESNQSTPATDTVTQDETPNNVVDEVESVGGKRKTRSVVWNHLRR